MPSGASSQEGGAPSPPRVQDCLWGGDKAHNRRVPVAVHAYSASTERARQLAAEAAASPYRTVEKARPCPAEGMSAGAGESSLLLGSVSQELLLPNACG